MPLYKGSPKKGKKNQGNQQPAGDQGNIKHPSKTGEISGGPSKGRVVSRHGRDKSIGKGRKSRRNKRY